MNWEEWPYGKQGYNVIPEILECPICTTPLRLVKNNGDFNHSELWDCICVTCRTRYLVALPPGRFTEPQTPDPIEERLRLAETRIAALESVIAQLTQEIASLKRERRQPPKTETLDSLDSLDSNDSLRSKYRHLL